MRHGVISIMVLGVILFFSISIQAIPTALDFSSSGGTLDGGAIASGSATWTVNIPSNFVKVETIQYDGANPTNMKKYMGWYGLLEANSNKVWEFKSWSSSTGGIIYDGTLGQEVKESTGSGLWIDATNLFHSGSNTVRFSHSNEGTIGLKIKVTVSESTPTPTQTSTPTPTQTSTPTTTATPTPTPTQTPTQTPSPISSSTECEKQMTSYGTYSTMYKCLKDCSVQYPCSRSLESLTCPSGRTCCFGGACSTTFGNGMNCYNDDALCTSGNCVNNKCAAKTSSSTPTSTPSATTTSTPSPITSCLDCEESPTPTATQWGAGECNGDSDCETKNCDSCDADRQICSVGKCVDCTYDGHCKSGYNCENKRCIKKSATSGCGNGICDSNEDCSNCATDCFTDKKGTCVNTDGKWVLCKYNTKEKYGQYCCNGKMQKEPCEGEVGRQGSPAVADSNLEAVLHGNANYLKNGFYEYPTANVKLSLFVKNGLQSNIGGFAKLFSGENTLLAKKPFWIKHGAEQYIDIDFTGKEGTSYDNIEVDVIYRKGDEEKSSVKSTSPIKIKVKSGGQQFQKLSLAKIIEKQKNGETGVYKTEVVVLNRIFANQDQLKQGFSLLGVLLGQTTPFDMINWIMENVYGKLYLVAGRTGKNAPALLLDQYGVFDKSEVKEGGIIEVVLDTEFLGKKLNPGTFLVGTSKADYYISQGYSMNFVDKLSAKPFGKLKDSSKTNEFEGYGFILARKMVDGKASYLLSDMDSEQWVVWEGGNAPTIKSHSLVNFKAGAGADKLYLSKMDGVGDYETEPFKETEKQKAVSIGFGNARYGLIKDYYAIGGDSGIGPALFGEGNCKIMWGVADLVVSYSSDNLQEGAKAIASSWERATDTDTSRGLKKYLSAFASSDSPTKDSVEAKKSSNLNDADKQKNIIYIVDSSQDKLYEQIKDNLSCNLNGDDSCLQIISSPLANGKYMVVLVINRKDAAYSDSGWKGLSAYIMPNKYCSKFKQALMMNQDYYLYKNGGIV